MINRNTLPNQVSVIFNYIGRMHVYANVENYLNLENLSTLGVNGSHFVGLLTALHKSLSLLCVSRHYQWIADNWEHVTESGEYRLQLYRADGCVREWREAPKFR